MGNGIPTRRNREPLMDIATAERLARIETQLEALPRLEKLMNEAIEELRNRDNSLEQGVKTRELFCTGQSGVVSHLATKISEHENRWKEMDGLLPDLRKLAKISTGLEVIAGIGAALGVLLVGLSYMVFTGQVKLVFP